MGCLLLVIWDFYLLDAAYGGVMGWVFFVVVYYVVAYGCSRYGLTLYITTSC